MSDAVARADLPFLVYRNLPRLFERRGVRLTGEPLRSGRAGELAERDEFRAALARFGYYRVDAAQPGAGSARLIVAILEETGKYSQKSGKLGDLLRSLARRIEKPAEAEVLVVSSDEVVHKQKHADALKRFRDEGEVGHCRLVPYRVLAQDVTRHASVPPHRIMEPQEVRRLLDWLKVDLSSLAYIYESDPPLVWLGARAGQCVEVDRPSETAGWAKCVRYVVAG
jgi:DNA-directed RNA polymerase subunit H (RpoH/RPB5)